MLELQIKILLCFSVVSSFSQTKDSIFDSVLPSFNLPVNFQTIQPECSKFQNDSTAKFQCDKPGFLQSYNASASEYLQLTGEDVLNCTQDVYQVLEANMTFQFHSSQVVYSGVCSIRLQAPRSMIFKIYAESPYPSAISDFYLMVYDQYIRTKLLISNLRDMTTPGSIYYSNVSYVTLEVAKSSVGKIEFSLIFEVAPGCTNQLQAYCISDDAGYIQTPWWNGVTTLYPAKMKSCVTLVVPDNHVVMVSLISLELETDNYCAYDHLELYMGPDCIGNKEKICQITDFYPSVYADVEALSFYFVSDSSVEKTGFRLLYTFHPNSSVPEKLPDGTWNCSVPFYSSFKLHFACNSEVLCSNGEDKSGCRTGGLCVKDAGLPVNPCYRLFQPNAEITWNEAAQKCESFRSHLLDLNSPEEWRNFTNMPTVHKDIFVGLKMASPTAPELYQYTWTWSDDTLVIYANISFNRSRENTCDANSRQYCGIIRKENNRSVSLISCDQKVAGAAYFCEMEDLSEGGEISTIQLPVPADQTLQPMMAQCFYNQTTHSFLACDVRTNCSAVDESSSALCSETKFSPAVPVFTCRSQSQRLPYTLVCDFRADCCDSSDEDFCQFPACLGGKEFACGDKKQCIPREQRCDRRQQCVDGSDELKCSDTLSRQDSMTNTLTPPALVSFTGLGNISVSPINSINSSMCPETHFQCPADGYCLPVYVRCNELYDCPGLEDEDDCYNYSCPGYFRCRGSKICVHSTHLCDGIAQCPYKDDELMCNFTCPDGCICYGYVFICSEQFLARKYPELRYLEASGTGMTLADVSSNRLLIYLSLQNCGITEIGKLDLPNLQSLDLSYNRLRTIKSDELGQLNNLRSLSLAFNSLLNLNQIVNFQFAYTVLREINLSGVYIQELSNTFSQTFPNLISLNLSSTGLTNLSESSFRNFKQIAQLDLRDCPLKTFPPLVFRGLLTLSVVYTDNYKMCCPTVLPPGFNPHNCHAPTDELSSCEALLRSEVFRVFLSLYAFLALVGNMGSFVYRALIEKSAIKMGYDVFVTHLCVADFLMGIYLAIIGVADRMYYGSYSWKDSEWTHSVACKIAGFLSLVSSEVSAFIICAITLERFLVLGFPHKNLRFRRWSAHVLCCNLWLVGLLLATVPLLPSTAHWEFYSQSGVCIPLPVTRTEFAGRDYAFAIMIGFNFVLFALIAVGQSLIYWSIYTNTISATNSSKKSRDMAVARRLLIVVMTDFFCWFPIGLLGMLARSGVPIPGEVNVAMAIFVLPFNSALNPFIYTFNVLMERRRKMLQDRQAREERSEIQSSMPSSRPAIIDTDRRSRKIYTEDEAWNLFNKLLADGILSPGRIRHRILDIDAGEK